MRLDLETSSRARFFALSLDMLCIADGEGWFRDLNDAWTSTLGWSLEDLKAAPFISFVHPDDKSATMAETAKLMAGLDTIGFENRYRCRDGSYRWLSWKATASPAEGVIYAVARDITEQRAAEDQLVEERNRLSAVLSSMADAAVITDPDGRVVSINPAMEELAGLSEDALRGRRFTDAVTLLNTRGEPIPHARRIITIAMASGRPVTSRGYDLSLEAGERRTPVHVSAAPVVDDAGRVLGGVAVVRDVSYEHEVDNMKSSLISTVSHELRTPLSMILGFSELMLTRKMDKTQSDQALNQIHDSAKRLARLIDDLLSVSRIESGHLKPRCGMQDIGRAVGDVVQSFAHLRQIHMDIPASCPPVAADPDHLTQILTNLVSNAVKYSTEPVTVSAGVTGETVSVAVADRGIGLTGDEIGRLFQKFVRIERPDVQHQPGTGLGLYITKRLVELQNGSVAVESRPGEGTTFTVMFPRVKETLL